VNHSVDVVSNRDGIGCLTHELESLESLLGSDEVLGSSESLLRVVVLKEGKEKRSASTSVAHADAGNDAEVEDSPA